MAELSEQEKANQAKAANGCAIGCMGLIGLFIFLSVVGQCSRGSSPPPQDPPAQEQQSSGWNVGGTLHGAMDSDWLAATEANRLATSADFAAKTKDKFGFTDEAGMKAAAIQIDACVTEAAKAKAGQKVAEIAAVCVLMLTKK